MKRLHISLGVRDLGESVSFYSTLFGAEPTVLKSDYAKWMLDDPRVNFVIETRGRRPGLDHLGIQAETPDELKEVADRLTAAERPVLEQKAANCCYAKSDKAWAADPQGIAWESFYSFGQTTLYGEDTKGLEELTSASAAAAPKACCAPASASEETS